MNRCEVNSTRGSRAVPVTPNHPSGLLTPGHRFCWPTSFPSQLAGRGQRPAQLPMGFRQALARASSLPYLKIRENFMCLECLADKRIARQGTAG